MKSIYFLFLFSLSSPLLAFTLNNPAGASFAANDVTINVEGSQQCQNIGMTNEELLDAAAEGVDDFWNRAPTSRLHLSKGQVVNLSSHYHTDTLCTSGTNCTPNPSIIVSSNILISCNNNATDFGSTAILGLTLPNNTQGRNIVGALILINDRSGSQFKNKTYHEKKTILAHEIGHAIGLGHSTIKNSLMYYAQDPNRSYLSDDDLKAISSLYPTEQPNFSSCGTIEENKDFPLQNIFLLSCGVLLGILLARNLLFKRSSTS